MAQRDFKSDRPRRDLRRIALLDGLDSDRRRHRKYQLSRFCHARREFIRCEKPPALAMKSHELLCLRLAWTSDRSNRSFCKESWTGRLASAVIRDRENKLAPGGRNHHGYPAGNQRDGRHCMTGKAQQALRVGRTQLGSPRERAIAVLDAESLRKLAEQDRATKATRS